MAHVGLPACVASLTFHIISDRLRLCTERAPRPNGKQPSSGYQETKTSRKKKNMEWKQLKVRRNEAMNLDVWLFLHCEQIFVERALKSVALTWISLCLTHNWSHFHFPFIEFSSLSRLDYKLSRTSASRAGRRALVYLFCIQLAEKNTLRFGLIMSLEDGADVQKAGERRNPWPWTLKM